MTRDVIQGSRNKTYSEQQALVTSYSEKTQIPYEVPSILDATVSILMEYVRTGTRLYGDSPKTYTRCQEQYDADRHLDVGGFVASVLYVNYGYYANGINGVGVQRKF